MSLKFYIYLFVMSFVTFLIRMIPFTFLNKKIKSRFLNSILFYMPYAVLAAMTVPAVFYSTSSVYSAAFGFAVAIILSFFKKSLITVALCSSAGALAVEFLISVILK